MKTIKIPKVTAKYVKVYCNISDVAEYKSGYGVTLKAQTVGGHKIPKIDRFWSETAPNVLGYIYVDQDKFNALLKTLFLDELRKTK